MAAVRKAIPGHCTETSALTSKDLILGDCQPRHQRCSANVSLSEPEKTAPAGSVSLLARIASGDYVPWLVFCVALCQFMFFTWRTLDQPIVDMWGFRLAQTAISVPYMLHQGAWLANVVPVFGEPWVLAQEFPLYQWCVALLVWVTGAPIDACGRLVSAFFAVAALWPVFLLAKAAGLTTTRRFTLLLGALWLLAPVVVFWGRSFLIETTTVFLGLGWLAFYVRFLTRCCLLSLRCARGRRQGHNVFRFHCRRVHLYMYIHVESARSLCQGPVSTVVSRRHRACFRGGIDGLEQLRG